MSELHELEVKIRNKATVKHSLALVNMLRASMLKNGPPLSESNVKVTEFDSSKDTLEFLED